MKMPSTTRIVNIALVVVAIGSAAIEVAQQAETRPMTWVAVISALLANLVKAFGRSAPQLELPPTLEKKQ